MMIDHGTSRGYSYGCRCDQCTAARRERNEKIIECEIRQLLRACDLGYWRLYHRETPDEFADRIIQEWGRTETAARVAAQKLRFSCVHVVDGRP